MNFSTTFSIDYDEKFMDHMDQKTLYRLAWTCRDSYARVHTYLQHALSIERLLQKFFYPSEWNAFRFIQFQTGLVISGSTALHFLSRSTHWYPDDLDLYVEHRYAFPVIKWLDSIGFQYYVPESWPFQELISVDLALEIEMVPFRRAGYHTSGTILNFIRGDSRIQLITTRSSILTCILNFHNTGVMNLITYNKAYCLHPNTTLFEKMILLRNRMPQDRLRSAAIKYHHRGYTIAFSLPGSVIPFNDRLQDDLVQILDQLIIFYRAYPGGPTCKIDIHYLDDPRILFPEGLRRIGDSRCWTFILPQSFPTATVSFIETNTWSFYFNQRRCYTIKTINLKGRGLQYDYTIACPSLEQRIKKVCNNWRRKYGPKHDNAVHAAVIAELEPDEGFHLWSSFYSQRIKGWSN